MAEKKLKHVAVDIENYEALSRLGGFHESFNDVISRLLLDANQKEKKRTPQGATVSSPAPSGFEVQSNTKPTPLSSSLTNEEELAHVG